jgi:hypothetical protein
MVEFARFELIVTQDRTGERPALDHFVWCV